MEDIMELSFIIEWGQPLRLEVFTLADDHPAENTGIRTFETGTDMRGDFVGYVHGTFNGA